MKIPFRVADGWPNDRASEKLQSQAVQALVTNHTLIVGQSRSGKTNAARRLIEEILVWTEAQVVILDPNADFKFLNLSRKNHGDKIFAKRWRAIAADTKVATPDGSAWGILWNKLSLDEMATYLRLTPQDSFAEFRHLDRQYKFQKGNVGTLQEFLRSRYFKVAVGEDLERYHFLLKELSTLGAWATSHTKKDLDSLLTESHKAVVVDLSIADEEARTITAARTLKALWDQGENLRKRFLQTGKPWPGTIVVIDEAHLFAPPSTEDSRRRAVCERIERLADQGKKLNLYLMVITQQPQKLHKGVLAECNNRIVLRVNERLSLKALEDTYGGLRGRYDGALTFNKGEALVEGALLCDEIPPPVTPRGAQFLWARTQEGGGTPEDDWANPTFV